jgi:phosphate transport system substrate-binding protein
MLRNRLAAAGFVAALTMAVVPAGASAAAAKITISGSTSVAPLTAKLIPAYLTGAGKGKATFTLYQGGSDIGVADVAAGRVVLGESSRDAKSSDPGGLSWYKIARDAICLITNSSNTVSNLTQAQVQGIFSGSTTSWSDIPGSTKTGSINVVVRTAASGTQDAFQKLFMGTGTVSSGASQKASNGLIQQTVASDPNAIGYVSEAFTAGTNVAKYKSVACSLKNAKTNAYGGVRNFWYVTKGAPTTATKAYIDWVRTNATAKTIIAAGWVPLS